MSAARGVVIFILHVCSVSPRKDYIVFSTASPPALQRVPWPNVEGEGGNARGGYDTWAVNEEELPWLVDADGTPHSENATSV